MNDSWNMYPDHSPLVSILIPTFRRPGLLKLALLSALAQSYKRIQIIVRDNFSEDETAAVVGSFNDERIVFLKADTKGDAISNLTGCLNAAEGDYTCILCDDDLLEQNYIDTLVSLTRNNSTVMYFASGVFVDSGGEAIKHAPKQRDDVLDGVAFVNEWCAYNLAFATPISTFSETAILRRAFAAVERFNFPKAHNWDNALIFWIALRGATGFTTKTTYHYRLHEQSTCSGIKNEENLAGDLAFLKFFDSQEDHAVPRLMTRRQWHITRKNVRAVLAGNYFERAVLQNLKTCSIAQNLLDLAIRPVPVFGLLMPLTLLPRAGLLFFTYLRRKAMLWRDQIQPRPDCETSA